jgi:hypothetical protein
MPATSAGMTSSSLAKSRVPGLFLHRDFLRKIKSFPGTRSEGATFTDMDRVFLAIIISGLLLAATSMSLLVATGGRTTVAELNVPPSGLSGQKAWPSLRHENVRPARDVR